MAIGIVYWGSYPGEFIEEVMSVLLLQERPKAQHRRPNQGDGGVDVFEPVDGGYHVFQIKRFTEKLSPEDRYKIKKSLESVKTNPRLDGPVVAWSLVIPLDANSDEEAWFRELTAEAGFDCDWKGLTFWQSEASKYSYVIDYFFENGKERLEQKVRTLAQLLGRPSDPVRPVDVVKSLGDLHHELKFADPYYRYDLRITTTPPPVDAQAAMSSTLPVEDGTFVTVDAYARFPQAVVDRPMGGKFTFTVFDPEAGVDIRDAFEAHQDYGTSFEIPPEAVRDASFNAPGGFNTSPNESSAWQIKIGAGAPRPDMPLWADIVVFAEDGTTSLGSALLPVATLSKGQKGLELRAWDPGEHLRLELRFPLPGAGAGRVECSIALEGVPGSPIAIVGPAYCLVANMRQPHSLRIRLRNAFTVLHDGGMSLGECPLVDWESGLFHLGLLEELQDYTSTPLVWAASQDEWQSVRRAAALLRGETYTFEEHWTGSVAGANDQLAAMREFIETEGSYGENGPLTLTNGGNEVLVGLCQIQCVGGRIVNIEDLPDDRVRVTFEGDSILESGSPLPANPEPPTAEEGNEESQI